MVRVRKLLVTLVMLGVSAAILGAYAGMLESVVPPERLPGEMTTAVGAVIVVLLVGAMGTKLLDRRAWTTAGGAAGLSTGGDVQFDSGPPKDADKPLLTGRRDGTPVRARSYTEGHKKRTGKKTYTVVEAELETPVDWQAGLGVTEASASPDDHGVDMAATQVVDGVGVRGDVDPEVAGEVLTPRVQEAVAAVEGEVSVGNPQMSAVGAATDAIGEADGATARVAEAMFGAVGDGDPDGLARVVRHRDRGLLTDADTLDRRVEAVAAVASTVDDAVRTTDHD
jgi:hypothetical protein